MITNERLLQLARLAAKRSYSPYSHFPVGAAVLLSNGHIYSGCNIENASYGLTICAERCVIFQAIAEGNNRTSQIAKIAVTCPKGSKDKPHTLMPCGACRQVIAEFGSPDTLVLIDGLEEMPLSALLPSPFKL